MIRTVIFDLDGTECIVDHRLHHLDSEPKDWASFHDALIHDPPNEPITWLTRMLARVQAGGEPVAIVIVTARHEPYRERTEQWLLDQKIFYDRLYMRRDNDFRPDHLVKAEILNDMLSDGYEPFLAVDDRPSVVAMWRSFGITCLQCAPDEPLLSKYAGQTLLHMLVGPSGAGKSSYCVQNYKSADIVSTDEIRKQLFGEHNGLDPESLFRTFRYTHDLIEARLKNGVFTVLDATNLKKKVRLNVLDAVPQGIVVQYVLLDRTYDEKIRDRGWRPVELIARHHQTFKNTTLEEVKNADDQGNVIVVDKRQHRI